MNKRNTFILITFIGVLLLEFSLMKENLILLYLSLFIIFWGLSFIYISSTKFVREDFVNIQIINCMITLNDLLSNIHKMSKTIVFPPLLPSENPIQRIIKDTTIISGISLIPFGLQLESEIEQKSDTPFFEVDINYLADFLPPILIKELSIVTDFSILQENDLIYATLQDYILQNTCNFIHGINKNICCQTPCPTCSAISCALVKVLHKPISIIDTTIDKNTLKVVFQISD